MSTLVSTQVTTLVSTKSGPVQGVVKDDVLLFSGIPYAAPPTGARRFQAAQPHPGWREVRDATRFGKAAPQLVTGGMTGSVPVRWDEDCLFLNIATPAADDQKRPVFFWIHGGAYRTGQGAVPWYNGTQFAKNGDVVTVSINYRLGALGFTDLSRFGADYATSGLNGILDQIVALEWVRDNIEKFGGDPDQITIGGESAGGFSVCTLLGSPRAQGLFQRAISQSGGAQHTLSKAAGKIVADAFLTTLDVGDMTGLLALSADAILEAQRKVDAEMAADMNARLDGVSAFYPVEGSAVLPRSPLLTIQDGISADVPVMTGTNKDEATLFLMGKSDAKKLSRLADSYGGGEALIAAYRQLYPDASTTELSIALWTDHSFRVPALRLAEARLNSNNTWMYLFSWESRAAHLKSTHALEIPFVFDNLNKPGVGLFIGPGESPQALADIMHAAWIAFIRTGDPGWPAYDLASRQTMVFDTTSGLQDDPDAGKHDAWATIR
ncbi:MAG: para-nitrobenzyl esterase [Candidatus Pseudothioglobus sp.]|jgi:para-nitrobenzyl esterase